VQCLPNYALARVSDAAVRDKPHGTPQPTRAAPQPYTGWSLLAARDASLRIWPRAAQPQGLSGNAVAASVASSALDANQKYFGGTMFGRSLARRRRQRSKFSSGDGKSSAPGVHTFAQQAAGGRFSRGLSVQRSSAPFPSVTPRTSNRLKANSPCSILAPGAKSSPRMQNARACLENVAGRASGGMLADAKPILCAFLCQ